MYDALNCRIKPLPPQTKVYFGHEYTVHNLKFANFVEPDNQAVSKRLELTTEQRSKGILTTPSTIQIESETNPFLRCDEKSIIENTVEKIIGETVDPVAVFTAIRHLRDGF